jgi:hypothetical protein
MVVNVMKLKKISVRHRISMRPPVTTLTWKDPG